MSHDIHVRIVMLLCCLAALLVYLAAILWCLWECVCCQLALKQRKRILDFTSRIPPLEAWSLLDQFSKVSYYEHVDALIRFKNPYHLYGDKVQNLLCK